MQQRYTAEIKKDNGWWIGWIEEIPGVNSQGKTRAELVADLRSALKDHLRSRGGGQDERDDRAEDR